MNINRSVVSIELFLNMSNTFMSSFNAPLPFGLVVHVELSTKLFSYFISIGFSWVWDVHKFLVIIGSALNLAVDITVKLTSRVINNCLACSNKAVKGFRDLGSKLELHVEDTLHVLNEFVLSVNGRFEILSLTVPFFGYMRSLSSHSRDSLEGF